jgi:hypothetical protein
MISIKRVPLNTSFSICDNIDPDSNVTEESDAHKEKQFQPKNLTELGTLTNATPVFRNASESILSNSDLFSITIDLMDSFS